MIPEAPARSLEAPPLASRLTLYVRDFLLGPSDSVMDMLRMVSSYEAKKSYRKRDVLLLYWKG